jgi:7-cyano-7-deazaguanine synthase
LSLIVIKSLVPSFKHQLYQLASLNRKDCAIAMGIHAGDHSIYPDCRQEFRDADFEAFKLGNWGSENVYLYTPYLHTDKFDILKDGEIVVLIFT